MRQSIIEGVLRTMLREVLSTTIDSLVSQYMRKRVLSGPEVTDPLENSVHRFNPVNLAARNMLDKIVREETVKLVKNEINHVDKDSIMRDYLFEASFIPYFNNVMLKNVIRGVANDTVNDLLIGEAVEDIVESQADNMIYEICVDSLKEERETESRELFKKNAEKGFYDNLLFQMMMESLVENYAHEESELIE